MILRILFGLFFTTQLQASSKIDFNELRLRQMAKVMNARDFDLMLNVLNQLEVLELACAKEQAAQKLPTSCLALDEQLQKFDIRPVFSSAQKAEWREQQKILTYKKSGQQELEKTGKRFE